MGLNQALSVLLTRPPQRKAEDLHQLTAFFSEQPFFARVDSSVLHELCSTLTLQRAAPGEEVLHVGELTDRILLLLAGSCSVVRHSRKEGFQPQPPCMMQPGQALCEASLVLSGRKSDVEVTAAPAAPGGSGGGAMFAVLTRAAWSNMCVRAPMQPVCGRARTALICCCIRSLAASAPPPVRTLEQSEDLAALMRLLPSLSFTPDPVLRAMSEAVELHRLPPGTIMFEESTRAESEFVVLSGSVQVRCRHRHMGGSLGGRTLARGSTRRTRPAAAVEGTKSVREMIEEEKKARETLKESLALTREPKAPPPPPTPPTKADSSRQWMSEFVDRARKVNPGLNEGAPGPLPPPGPPSPLPTAKSSTPGASGAVTAPGGGESNTRAAAAALAGSPVFPSSSRGLGMSRAANAWRRAMLRVADAEAPREDGEGEEHVEEGGMLAEYERLKREEAGDVTDVGNLLGGAGARDAYYRGIQEANTRHYGYGYEDDVVPSAESVEVPASPEPQPYAAPDPAPPVHDPVADPRVRLVYLDTQFQVASQVVRFDEALDRLTRLVDGRSLKGATDAAEVAEPTLLNDAPGGTDGSGGVVAAGEEHLTQLYGPDIGFVDAGQVAGELPEGALNRAAGIGGPGGAGGAGAGGAGAQPGGRPRRTDTTLAGPTGADVLVVVLETLRRGHTAARDDLVSERLAVLTALEPLRGLSDDHQAQLALGCTATTLDTNQFIARQGLPVDALYVVLEGEVRLLDESLEALAAATAAAQHSTSAGGGGSGGGNGAALPGSAPLPSRIMSLNSSQLARRAGVIASLGVTGVVGDSSIGGGRPRRGLMALPALTLLGPGGSFGESVLGYPEDAAAEAAADAASEEGGDGKGPGEANDSDNTDSGDEGAGGSCVGTADGEGIRAAAGAGSGFALGYSASLINSHGMFSSRGRADRTAPAARTPTLYLASAVTSRPTKLLVLPRSLLVKYGYLRASLPPFADLRREALNMRRQQLKSSLQNLSSLSLGGLGMGGLSSLAALPEGQPLAPVGALGSASTTGMAPVVPGVGAGGGGGGAGVPMRRVSGPGALSKSPSMPPPRPPPPRPLEFLEQMGFKALNNPRTAAILSSLGGNNTSTGGASSGSGNSTPERRRGGPSTATAAVVAAAIAAATATAGGSASAAGGSPFLGSPVARPGSPSAATAQGTPTAAPSTGIGSRGGGGAGGVATPPALSTAERARRLLLLGGPDWPSRTVSHNRSAPLWQVLDSAGDPAGDLASPFHLGAASGPLDVPDLTNEAIDEAALADSAACLTINAPPKPCLFRTSLNGTRGFSYNTGGGGSSRALPVYRTSLSGLPSFGGLDAATANAGGLVARRSSFNPPPPLRLDSPTGDDGAAGTGAAESLLSPATRAPPNPHSGGLSHVTAWPSPGAHGPVAGAATPTRGSGSLPLLSIGGGMGSRPDSPALGVPKTLLPDGTGTPTNTSAITTPASGGGHRASGSGFLPAPSSRWIPGLPSQDSLAGGSFGGSTGGTLLLGPQGGGEPDVMPSYRESAPGGGATSYLHAAHPQPPSLMLSTGWSGVIASPRTARMRTRSAAGRPPTQLELLLHATGSTDAVQRRGSNSGNGGGSGGVGSDPLLGIVPLRGGHDLPPGLAGVSIPAVPARLTMKGRSEVSSSWDGSLVRQVQKEKGGLGAAALAVAVLAAGVPPEHQYLL